MKNKPSPLTDVTDGTPLKLGEGLDIPGFVPNTGFNKDYTVTEEAPYGYTESGNIRQQKTIGESVRSTIGDPAYEKILNRINKIVGGKIIGTTIVSDDDDDDDDESATTSNIATISEYGWDYKQINEDTYQTKKIGSTDWITVTSESNSKAFNAIKDLFVTKNLKKKHEDPTPTWQKLNFPSEQDYLDYKEYFGGKMPWEQGI